MKAKQTRGRKPGAGAESTAWFDDAVRRLAARCELAEPRYRQQVLKRAVESAERRGQPDNAGGVRKLADRVQWAAGTTGARTDADVVRWMENAT